MSVARLIIPAVRWKPDAGFSHEQPAIDEALALGVGGFIIFGGTTEATSQLTNDLRDRAGRPLLIGADLERGAGQQVAGLSELPPPLALAALGDLEMTRFAGWETAAQARAVGINWIFAPDADLDIVADNPIVQTRSFGADPVHVGAQVAAWVDGCQQGGALACAKHFPGHGRTHLDPHVALPIVYAARAALVEQDRLPFQSAINAGVASIMTAHVAYPSLDPAGVPATFSGPILSALRTELGFDGLIVSDALIMEGAVGGRGGAEAAVAALRAGVDLLLYPEHPSLVAREVERACQVDRGLDASIEKALDRYEKALATALRPSPGRAPSHHTSRELAAKLLTNGMLRGRVPRLRAPLQLEIVDDDLEGTYPPGSSDLVRESLVRYRVGLGPGGSRVLCTFAEPRAGKGRANFGRRTEAVLAALAGQVALIVHFGHPRLLSQIPGEVPVLLAWHRQRLMQEAVADWIRHALDAPP